MFTTMKNTGCIPDVMTYTSIIHACSTAGNISILQILSVHVGKKTISTLIPKSLII